METFNIRSAATLRVLPFCWSNFDDTHWPVCDIVGAIVVPALSLTTGMNHYEALGTSLCAMVLPAMVGTATHYRRGNVAMIAAPALAAGAFAGAYFGGKLGLAIPEDNLKYGFSGLMVVLGLRTLLK